MKETNENVQEDEISLLELLAVVWQRKIMIICLTVAVSVIAVILSVISLILPPEKSFMPNVYSPKALMLINDTSSSRGGLSSLISSSGMAGLASLAGVSVPRGQSYSGLASYLIGTDTFLDAVADRFDIVERYKITESFRANSRRALKEILTAEFDDKSGVLSISFTDLDPVFARDVVNFCVDYLGNLFKELGLDKSVLEKANLEQNIKNTYAEIQRLQEESQRLERSVSTANGGSLPSIMLETRRLNLELNAQQEVYRQLKVQLEMTNVSIASETLVFQILQMAEVPDMKSGPSRGMVCIIACFGSFSFSLFLTVALNALENIKKDTEVMAKFKLNTKKENK